MKAEGGSTQQAENYGDLRGWIERVEALGELKRVSGAHWDAEMGAITHMLTEKSRGDAPAILFDEIPGLPKGISHALRAFLFGAPGRAHARFAARVRTQGRHRQALP